MMDVLQVLIGFFMISIAITIAVDMLTQVIKPIADVSKFKLIMALLIVAPTIVAYNHGILEALDVPLDISRPWFHEMDLLITILFLTGGAQSFHRLNDARNEYRQKGGANNENRTG